MSFRFPVARHARFGYLVGRARSVFIGMLFVGLVTSVTVSAAEPRSWDDALRRLDENRSSPEYGNILLSTVSLAPSLNELEMLLEERLANVTDSAVRGEILYRTGRVFETANRFESAMDWYERAVDEDRNHKSAMRDYAVLLMELGELEKAINRLTAIINTTREYSVQRSAGLLRARAFLLGGDLARARAHAHALAGEEAGRFDDPGPLFLLYEIALSAEDDELKSTVTERFREEFPDTPEYALISGDESVAFYPVPSRIFGGLPEQALREPPAVTVDVPDEIPREEPDVSWEEEVREVTEDESRRDRELHAVQTGSFRDRENAEYMVRDLKEIGFDAIVTDTERETGTFYRVLIPVEPGASVDDAQNLIVRLKEHGVEGFLVFHR